MSVRWVFWILVATVLVDSALFDGVDSALSLSLPLSASVFSALRDFHNGDHWALDELNASERRAVFDLLDVMHNLFPNVDLMLVTTSEFLEYARRAMWALMDPAAANVDALGMDVE